MIQFNQSDHDLDTDMRAFIPTISAGATPQGLSGRLALAKVAGSNILETT
ncbi:hypothetical protein [Bradyrhizobium sp. Ai1a-2]|nr:hypothetical protein [Bradyrhizobium sp. Ai1a-2]